MAAMRIECRSNMTAAGRCTRGRRSRTVLRRVAQGYTLVELMIVIAIIGILIALLLPAVQACREAARRNLCTNNLVQISLALAQYEMAHSAFPAGTLDAGGPILNQPSGYHHNWIIALLPFLEEQNADRHIDRTASVYDPRNLPVRRLDLSLLRCPSSSPGNAFSEYAGVHNDLEAPIDANNHGVFFLNRSIRVEEVTDGTSCTLFVGEKFTGIADLGWMSGTRATLRNTGVPINWPGERWKYTNDWIPSGYPLGIDANAKEATGDALLNALFGGPEMSSIVWSRKQMDGMGGYSNNTEIAANDTTDNAGPSFHRPTNPLLAVGGFGSAHPGGASFAFGDGSVHYLSSTLDPAVLTLLGNRADRQMVDPHDW